MTNFHFTDTDSKIKCSAAGELRHYVSYTECAPPPPLQLSAVIFSKGTGDAGQAAVYPLGVCEVQLKVSVKGKVCVCAGVIALCSEC